MSSSLRDQLVKAGLASASTAKKIEREQLQAQHTQRQGQGKSKKGKSGQAAQDADATKTNSASANPASPEAIAKARARQLQAEKVQRDRAIARVRNEKSAEKAQRAEIKQLISQNDVRAKEAREDDLPYNFVHGKKIKRIYVPKQQLDALSAGQLVIVNNDGRYHIVSKSVSERIAQRDPKWIIAAHDQNSSSTTTEDEYYKQFAVPDDLDW